MNACAVASPAQKPANAMVNGSVTPSDDVIVLDDDDVERSRVTSPKNDVTIIDDVVEKAGENGLVKGDVDRMKKLASDVGASDTVLKEPSLDESDGKEGKVVNNGPNNADTYEVAIIEHKKEAEAVNDVASGAKCISGNDKREDVTDETKKAKETDIDLVEKKKTDTEDEIILSENTESQKSDDVVLMEDDVGKPSDCDNEKSDVARKESKSDDVMMLDDNVKNTSDSENAKSDVMNESSKSDDVMLLDDFVKTMEKSKEKTDVMNESKSDDVMMLDDDVKTVRNLNEKTDVMNESKSDDVVMLDADVKTVGNSNEKTDVMNDSKSDDVMMLDDDVKTSDGENAKTDVMNESKSDDVMMLDDDVKTSDGENAKTDAVNVSKSDDVMMLDDDVKTSKVENEKPDDLKKESKVDVVKCDISTKNTKDIELLKSGEKDEVLKDHSSENHNNELEPVLSNDKCEKDSQDSSLILIEPENEAKESNDSKVSEVKSAENEDALLVDDPCASNSRRSSVASVKSDILLESPAPSPSKVEEDKTDDVILVDSQSRKRPMSRSSETSDESTAKKSRISDRNSPATVGKSRNGDRKSPETVGKSRNGDRKSPETVGKSRDGDRSTPERVRKSRSTDGESDKGSVGDDQTRDDSDVGELLTVLNDEMLHGLVRQKLNGLLAKEIDQVLAPMRKRISELQNTSEWWKEKAVNLQKQINDLNVVQMRNETKAGAANKPSMRTVAVQVCTTTTRVLQVPKQPGQPSLPNKSPMMSNKPGPLSSKVSRSMSPSSPLKLPMSLQLGPLANLNKSSISPAKPMVMYSQQAPVTPSSAVTSNSTAGGPAYISQLAANKPMSSVQPAVNTGNKPTSMGLQAFVLSPPQATSAPSSAAPSSTAVLRTLSSIANRSNTVREMLSSRNPQPQPQKPQPPKPSSVVAASAAASSAAASAAQNVLPVTSLVPAANGKPATIKITNGNMVIDLTSDEEKRNKQLAGLVQGMVVPTSSIALNSSTQSQPIFIGGNNVPMILQTLNAQQLQGNQNILLTQPNSNNVISLVQTSTGLKTTTPLLSPPNVALHTKATPVSLNQGAPGGAAVPVAIQRATTSAVPPVHQIRVSAPSITPTVPALAALGTAPMKHPAPLPPNPVSVNVSSTKREPPRPTLKISRVSQGIVLSWNMALSPLCEEVTNYQLYAYQEGNAAPCTSLWKRVGDVKALPLPMACTLTMFQEGNRYHFAVRAVDKVGRVGPFSEPASIYLAVSKV